MLNTRFAALCILSGITGILLSHGVFAQTPISSPITVPLYFTQTDSGAEKLGIYVGIGSGATPTLFEFDTGGSGLYGAYASTNPGVSPWWGSGVTTVSQPVSNTYDSGFQYTGTLAQAPVMLFSSSTAATPAVSSANTSQIGQMNSIVKVSPSDPDKVVQTYWTPTGQATANPPVDGAFYGDFGVSPMYATNGITSLVSQLDYTSGVTAGYRIHVDPNTQKAHIQIGLTDADTKSSTAFYFNMNVDTNANGALNPVSNVNYFSQQTFNATITIKDKDGQTLTSRDVGMTADTGATTTIHNTTNTTAPQTTGNYDDFIAWNPNQTNQAGNLNDNLGFMLSGTTTSNEAVDYFKFRTSSTVNDGDVQVQNNRPDNPTYYLNTGISFFYHYDVIYDLENHIIGLEVVPEPGALVLLLGGLAGLGLWKFRHKLPGRNKSTIANP